MSRGGRVQIPPLAKEEPVLYRPTLAAAFGPLAAALLERAHGLQCVLGRVATFQYQGRAVERVIFPWSPKDRETLAGWSARQVRRVFSDLAGRSDDATVSPTDEVLLWQHSWRDEDGRQSRDWFSVNYAAVGRACPTVAVHLSAGVMDAGVRGQNVQSPRSFRPKSSDVLTENFGQNVPAHLKGPLLSSPSTSLPPSRARVVSVLQSGDGGDAVDVLVSLGFDAFDAAQVVARWPDGAVRARVMAANVALLRAAGYEFDPWPPRGFVVTGMRDAWPALSPAEAAARVAARRSRANAPAARGALTLDERLDAARGQL